MSSLTEHIDPKCLPTQYGGILELETIYGEAFVELICCFQDKIDGNFSSFMYISVNINFIYFIFNQSLHKLLN